MLNLLPENKKKLVKKEYRSRFLIVLSAFGTLTMILGLVLLLPSFLLTKIRYHQAFIENTALEDQINVEKSKETNFTDKQRQMLNVLQGAPGTTTKPTELINAVLGVRGSSILLTDFSYQNDESQTIFLIHGKSLTRQDLIIFKQKLEEDKKWKEVDLPIADLGPASNNEFTISLKIN